MWSFKNSETTAYMFVLTISASLCLGTSSFNGMQSSPERIVSDLEIIESPNGVPVDFTYNETNGEDGFLTSVPGCPKSIDGYPWVYFGNQPRCHVASYSGPCGDKRYLFVEQGSPFGVCVCECFKLFLDIGRPDYIETSPNGRYKFCGYHTGYDSQKKICYNLNERGPCAPGQWLVRSISDSLTCIAECPIVDGIWQSYNGKTGQCEKQFPGGGGAGGGSGSFIAPNRCLDRERYSSILRRFIMVEQGQDEVGIARNRCPDREHYSKTLQGCVLKNPTNSFVLG